MSPLLKHWQAVLVVAIVLALAIGWYAGRSDEPGPDELAESIGATYCDKTSFTIESKLDGDTRTVYDCYFSDVARHRCVTESDNIAKDETDTVTALFQDTFATDKPTCAQ